MNNIRKKFYLLTVILTLAIVLVLSMQYNDLNKRIKDNNSKNIDATITYIAHQVEENLNHQKQYINIASQLLSDRNLSDEQIYFYLTEFLKEGELIRTFYFGKEDGTLINTDDWVYPEGYIVKQRPWYVKAIESEETIITDAYIDSYENIVVITVAKTVYGPDGNVFGVVAADISLENIRALVNDTKIDMGKSFLIDGRGYLLSNEDSKSNSKLVYIDSLFPGLNKKIVEGKELFIEADYMGIEGTLRYKKILESDLILLTFLSSDELKSTEIDILGIVVIGLAISVFLIIYFNSLQNKVFIKPVEKLESDIKKIDLEFNVEYRVPIEDKYLFKDVRTIINNILSRNQEVLKQSESQKEEIVAQNEELEASYNQLAAMSDELRVKYNEVVAAEEELTKALNWNKAVISASPDILFVITKEGKFTDIYTSREDELYLRKEALMERYIKDLFPEEIIDIATKRIKKVIENNSIESFEYKLKINDKINDYEIRMARIDDENLVALSRNITDRKTLEKKLIDLSYKDQLTGLNNRRSYEEYMQLLNTKDNLPLSIVIADVNGLKMINDSFGHKVGDHLLKDVSNRILEYTRPDHVVNRISGDEFVIIMPNTTYDEAEEIVKKIKGTDLDSKENVGKLSNIEISVSFGINTKYRDNDPIEEIFKKAEDRMYTNKLFEGPSMRSNTIETIMKALYEKNKREEEHSNRVATIAKEIGTAMGLSEERLNEIEKAGLLHDIGKIAISETILDKPGQLEAEEWKEIQRHPEIGYRILSTVNELSHIADYILSHHERYDGKGYPLGLKGKEIPMVSRIIAIADSYDAMAKDRPYRLGLDKDSIIKELRNNAGIQFDPEIVKIFIEKVLKN